jgi:uncharacterized zinc-type alcohol dehydrogenase-like protein
MLVCHGFAAKNADSPLVPFSFQRREPGPTDIQIDIMYCGVCHSDIHMARGEWGNSVFPVLPGHEIVGRVTAVGAEVKNFKVGDLAGVGCMVDSCKTCASCQRGLEQYCEVGFTGTYNDPDRKTPGQHTYGGYSKFIVVQESFVLRIPENLELAAVGQKVGVVGLGGLGHMALKLAHAMGAKVTLFTTSPGKADDAKRLGADRVVISKDADAMAAERGSFDFIIDCVAAKHDINAYLALLKLDATLVQVGAPAEPLPVQVFSLIFPRRTFAGSLIGGVAETQEMLDFCADHNIVCDIEMIRMDQVNEAYDRVVAGDVKYRFVIDMKTLPEA